MIANTWIIPLFPLGAACLVFFLGKRVSRISGYLTSGMIFLALIAALKVLSYFITHPDIKQYAVTWLKTAGQLKIEAGILLDPLSIIMMVIVLMVSFMVHLYSIGYMKEDEHQSRYFAFLSFFTFSMLGLVIANNLIMLYMFWELVGLSSYLLIGFWNHKPEAANAAKKAFIVTRFGDLGFLIAILIIGFTINDFNIINLGAAATSGKLAGGMATLVALLIFAGAAGKSGQFPLHIWLPDAMEGPTPVSALIHAATMVAAGVFLVARVFPIFEASPTAMSVVATVGGFTALFAATIACVQNDIKRILAYSTLSQLGYMMMALGCGGYLAGMFHLTTHAGFKALLFLCAGSVIHAVHTNNIWEMGGLGKTMKVTALTMVIAGLALAGIPPLSGFFSKDAVLLATLAANRMDLLTVGLITALLTSFYIARLFFVVFTGKPQAAHDGHESSTIMTMPLMILAVLTMIMGFAGKGLNHFMHSSFGAPELGHEVHNRLVPMAAFIAAVLGIGWAYLVYGQKAISAALLERKFLFIHALLKNKYYIDEVYMFLVKRVMFSISALLSWFDRYVVDGAVNGVAWCCRKTGDGIRLLQVGRLQAYMLAFIIGLIVLLVSLFINHPDVLNMVASIKK